ncbi:putative molybdenum carrier protein [Larsenimonas rhizosphaerae]|uniref:putative molybdenum carrier protein n=1 Tax=Larsenimonas rhizosphaerae TaxID=2944682 RepID=UPI0020333E4B|nr:putative molybdenum carrier protein [Larsenimonas rhizosphaerae]MCM2131075.1 putative molybdenum carrier protein [Larsenimonas rhizosphaerae]
MLSKVISGGQTRADRAALDAGLDAGFPIGGSCPVGRVAEDGPLADIYPLTEIGGGYRQRTKHNVIDADGTVVFYASYVRGGTEATVLFCIRQGRPYKLIDIHLIMPDQAAALLIDFINDFNVEVLNVAGPGAGNCPEMYTHVKQTMSLFIRQAIG